MSNNKLILTDGMKAVTLTGSEGWTYFSNPPRQDSDRYYAQVAAAFRAYNLKANTVGNMPFALMKGKEVFDQSSAWENKVGFLPNPSEWLRLATLSYMASNAVYNLITSDALGYKARGMYFLTPYSCIPQLNAQGTQVDYIERNLGTQLERYGMDGKQIYPIGSTQRLVFLWRLDHTTELLPSRNTEAQAIMNAAGVLHSADTWIRHFFERGGVSPFLIAMKGMVAPDKQKEEEQKWSDWYLGLRDRFKRIFKITNAESMDIKQIGQGVGDLKDNETYNQAIANIAMGTGMPLSLLMANSSNYATAKEEKSTWYENDIIPLCNWLAYEYNRQIFTPLGLRLEFHPETLDPQQEDETERANAISTFADFFAKCESYELFIGMCETFGYEISDSLDAAAKKYYADKAARAEAVQIQTQPKPDTTPAQQDTQAQEQQPAKATIKALEDSAMIALRIPDVIRDEIKEKYPFIDEETLSSLHITLVYLGDSRTLNKIAAVRAVSEFAQYQSPIKGTLQGLARFVNGGDKDPLVVTFDSPQMPRVYTGMASALDSYHVPYHKDHGFIPHMTLAYIPSDAEMPIDSIEPMEINFSELYLVDGDEWMPVTLTGYDNKTAKWQPTIKELDEMRVWRKACLQKLKKGEPLTFEYIPHYGGLPESVVSDIKARLAEDREWNTDRVNMVFDVARIVAEAPQEEESELKILARAMDKLANVEMQKVELSKK